MQTATYHAEKWGIIHGYNFEIYRGKVAYVGDMETRRAAVWGLNGITINTVFSGDYTNLMPPMGDLMAYQRLLDWLRSLSIWNEIPELVGHKDIALFGHGTACPGNLWDKATKWGLR